MLLQVPNVTVTVPVSPCRNGSVQQGDICTYCTAPQYSFNPLGSNRSGLCDVPCPNHAECFGGATVLPSSGYWISGPWSDSLVPCPKSDACTGASPGLIGCMTAANQSSADPQVPLAKQEMVDCSFQCLNG